MLKNLFSKSDDTKIDPNVVADLKRTVSPGDRVGFFANKELIGKAKIVAIEKDQILFEALSPVDDLLEAEQIVNIERGIPWDFKIRSLTEVTEGNDSYLRCTIPASIHINSRRDNFRVAIPVSFDYEISFFIGEKHHKARILDLSCTGAQIRVPSNSNFSKEQQDLMHDAELHLGEQLHCPVNFKVQWLHYLEETARMGIEFSNLSAKQADTIHRMVNEIERETIRKNQLLKKD